MRNVSKKATVAEPGTADKKPVRRIPLLTRSGKQPNPQRAIELLRKRSEEDPEEQRETWEYLRKALDEDRPSYRKLFPPSEPAASHVS